MLVTYFELKRRLKEILIIANEFANTRNEVCIYPTSEMAGYVTRSILSEIQLDSFFFPNWFPYQSQRNQSALLFTHC